MTCDVKIIQMLHQQKGEKIFENPQETILKAKLEGEASLIRIFNMNNVSFKGYQRFANSLMIFTGLQHPFVQNISKYETACENGKHLLFVATPDKNYKNLFEELQAKREISATTKTNIAFAIAHVLSVLHANNVPFGQLESKSVLFNDTEVVLACSAMDVHTNKFGIFPWIAPEALSRNNSPQADIYSYGVILYELYTSMLPLSTSSDKNQLMGKVMSGIRPKLEKSALADLISNCWTQNANLRHTANEILKVFTDKTLLFNGADQELVDQFIARSNSGQISCNVKPFEPSEDPVYQVFRATFMSDEAENLIKSAAEKKLPLAMFTQSLQLEQEQKINESKKLLSEAAQAGYGPALAKLGIVALSANKMEDAAQLFKRAADLDDIVGITNYGKMLLLGVGIKQNIVDGLVYLRKGVNEGDSISQLVLGSYLIESGKYEDGINMLKLSASQGNPTAQLTVACEYANKDSPYYNPKLALQMLLDLSKHGETDAMLKAGKLLQEGADGVVKDQKRAYELFRQALDAGNELALLETAECLVNGIGVDKNMSQGLEMFQAAATKGDPEAMYRLAKYMQLIDQNASRGWLNKAAEKEHPASLYRLYKLTDDVNYLRRAAQAHDPFALFEFGQLVYEEGAKSEALQMYKIAAVKGHYAAAVAYGTALIKGDGISKNLQEGMAFLQNAAMTGFPPAVTTLGKMLIEGEDLQKNEQAGAQMIEASAKDGYPVAMYEYAKLLLEGKIVKKDEKRAKELLKTAAEKGEKKAQDELDKLK